MSRTTDDANRQTTTSLFIVIYYNIIIPILVRRKFCDKYTKNDIVYHIEFCSGNKFYEFVYYYNLC